MMLEGTIEVSIKSYRKFPASMFFERKMCLHVGGGYIMHSPIPSAEALESIQGMVMIPQDLATRW